MRTAPTTPTNDVESGDATDRRIDTTISTLIMAGDRVWKMRKPVAFAFLDQRGLETQRRLCLREVELNSRLAPDVYLGVVDVHDPFSGETRPATLMRRLPDSRRLAALIATGVDLRAEIRQVARTLAVFHTAARSGTQVARSATPSADAARWHGCLAVAERWAGSILDGKDVASVRRLAEDYVTGCAPLLLRRLADGKVVDGHGDLLADDIFCLADGPRILDCLEFDDTLRCCDVVSDVASLAMDCERLESAALGELLLREYATYSRDVFPDSLAHHYIAYRAMVRCEVACHSHEQGDPNAAATARQLLSIALAHCRLARPAMVLVGGPPGAGKSTIAAAVGDSLGWTVIRSDEVRRDVLGGERWAGSSEWLASRFAVGATAATYAEVIKRAALLLGLGESVILDATWSAPARRAEAERVAADAHATFTPLRCETPAQVAERRVARRIAAGSDISAATVAVARRIARAFHPWPRAQRLNTAAPLDQTISGALQAIRLARVA